MKIQEAIAQLRETKGMLKTWDSLLGMYSEDIKAIETLIEAVEKAREVLGEVESISTVERVKILTTKDEKELLEGYSSVSKQYNSLICVLRAGLGVVEDEDIKNNNW